MIRVQLYLVCYVAACASPLQQPGVVVDPHGPRMAREAALEFGADIGASLAEVPRDSIRTAVSRTADSLAMHWSMQGRCSRFIDAGHTTIVYLVAHCRPEKGMFLDGEFLAAIDETGRYRYGRVPRLTDSLGFLETP